MKKNLLKFTKTAEWLIGMHMIKKFSPEKKITLIASLLALFFTSCTPAEVAIIETVTEEALLIEKDLLEPHEKVEEPTVTAPKLNSSPIDDRTGPYIPTKKGNGA